MPRVGVPLFMIELERLLIMGRVFSQDLYRKYPNLDKYSIVYVVRQMVKEGLCKTPVQGLQLLETDDIDVDGLIRRIHNGPDEAVSTSDDEDEENQEDPKA